MVQIFTRVMSCYDWAASKSLYNLVGFCTKLWGSVCLAGLKFAGARLRDGIGEEELRRGMREGDSRGGYGVEDWGGRLRNGIRSSSSKIRRLVLRFCSRISRNFSLKVVV